MTLRLEPEDRISKYRIVGPIGAGGMGEVYLAEDLSLERKVALKSLPSELVLSEERVRRFVQEAKSASSLNHPNIVTIYDIGHDAVRRAGLDAPLEPVHFISMELVTGKTLAALIHGDATDLRTLLGYLVQAAEGLSKAHLAGIVHRDLKPGNIMVSSDGFTKILDFGLAKLIERPQPVAQPPYAPTVALEATAEGRILGTVGYMAPEQVQGKPVDHRADIFAFGCILYEACTRRRAFDADSSVETMHKILHTDPPPVETVNAAIPAQLRRLIRRCLAKNADQRLQSMKDLAIELREIVEDYDALPTVSSSDMRRLPEPGPEPHRRSAWAWIGLLIMAALALGVWALRGGHSPKSTEIQYQRPISLTSRGDLNECAISRDGRYLAYLTSISGVSSIHVLQVATGSDVEVASSDHAALEGLIFSPDGNYLWYLEREKNTPNYRTLMQIPSLGGAARERVFDVDSRVSFSPDGTRIAFRRGVPQNNKELLLLRDLDSGTEKTVESFALPDHVTAIAWSPDGKDLGVIDWGNRVMSTILLFPTKGGPKKTLCEVQGSRFQSMDWLPDGRGIVVAGQAVTSVNSQIYRVSLPQGVIKPLTNDLSHYLGVSVASDGSIAAVRQLRLGTIWVADPEGNGPVPALAVSNPDRTPYAVTSLDNEHVHFTAINDQDVSLFSIPLSGGEPRLLTPAGGFVYRIDAYAGGALLTRLERKDLLMHIWRIEADGSNLRQVTQGVGETTVDVTRDGKMMLYTRIDSTGLWLAPVDGGEPRLVGGNPKFRFGGMFSPDGKWLVAAELVAEGNLNTPWWHVFSVADGHEVFKFLGLKNGQFARWAQAAETFYFLDTSDPSWNLCLLHARTNEIEPLTAFTEGRVQDYAVAPGGRRIALGLRRGEDENVWVTGPDGKDPRQITQFTAQKVFSLVWTPDGRRLVIYAGQIGRDAVVMKTSPGAR